MYKKSHLITLFQLLIVIVNKVYILHCFKDIYFQSDLHTFLQIQLQAFAVVVMLNKNTLGVKKVRGQSEATMVI